MELLNSFLGQGMIAQIGEIVLFANTVTMAMPTRWRGNMMMDYLSKILNYLAMTSVRTETWVTYKPTNHIGWNPLLASFQFLVGCI